MRAWATVVDVNDPLGLRRVKVRIRAVHGDNFPESHLPWAETAQAGGAPDSGEYPVFVKGQSVMVDLEYDDITRPTVIGAATKVYESEQQVYGDTGWKPAGSGNDVPLEAKDPTVDCKFKTHNGAALFVREKPGEEGLLLVDRAGQYVEMSSPTSAEEVGSLKRGETKAPSSEFEGLLVAEAFVKAMDLSGNKVYLRTGTDGTSSALVENPRNGNSFKFDEDGLRIDVLGGMSNGGLTLVMDAAGLRLNNVELATRKFVDLFDTFSSMVALSSKPGTPAPMFPAKKAVFDVRKGASINADGLMTKL